MTTDRFKINYTQKSSWGKDLFLFVNHKTATICWAKLVAKKGRCDVITFDSHGDFHYGIITQADLSALWRLNENKQFLGSKYTRTDLPHFTTCTEFMEWDLSDDDMNCELVEKQHKFFLQNNDNFIDVAFMKNIVKDVHCYYLNQQGNTNSGKCDDFNGDDHFFNINKIDKFIEPDKQFILDIDLDFFALYDLRYNLIKESEMRGYLELMKSLGQREDCIGITVALEPDCCGSDTNCPP